MVRETFMTTKGIRKMMVFSMYTAVQKLGGKYWNVF